MSLFLSSETVLTSGRFLFSNHFLEKNAGKSFESLSKLSAASREAKFTFQNPSLDATRPCDTHSRNIIVNGAHHESEENAAPIPTC